VISWLRGLYRRLFAPAPATPPTWPGAWSDFLEQKSSFYRALGPEDRSLFNQRVQLFLDTTLVDATQFDVTDEDRLLVAASAIIPVWRFPGWHYFNLNTVFLMPAAFNDRFECGEFDSSITGMVGNGPMAGRMVLSRPALHQGFDIANDKRNVGIHEFVHLIDMADGDLDGYPERLREYAFSIPWFELVARKSSEIYKGKSNIRDYGGVNRAEFLSVASEYFFERPAMLRRKHPKLYEALSGIYRQEVQDIREHTGPRKKDPCPCGSGKRYKRCCMPVD
jgi:MtfA peptidase